MKTAKISVLAMALVALSLIAWGLKRTYLQPVKKTIAVKDAPKPVIHYDPVLWAAYGKLYKKFDTVRSNYTMAGSINVINPADTLQNMKDIRFFFCKQGDEFYYKLGLTETLNAKGKYIYIDNGSQQMLVSQQKLVQYDQSPFSFADLGKKLSSENYRMGAAVNRKFKTIAFSCEHHASCKQFSITYDTLNSEITGLSARLTNIQEPLRNDRDKLVDIKISEWTEKAELSNYSDMGKYLTTADGHLRGADKYRNYRVITQ